MVSQAWTAGGQPAGSAPVSRGAPSAPADRLAARAAGEARELDVAPPRQPSDDLARLTGVGAGHDGRRYLKSDHVEVLHVLGYEEAAGVEELHPRIGVRAEISMAQ